jgi:hypothetical protein
MRKAFAVRVAAILLAGAFTAACQTGAGVYESAPPVVHFSNANEWETYFSLHNIKAAQLHSQGQGVKVGILDPSFGYDVHPGLYEGSMDFLNQSDQLHKVSWHGYWMAATLKEIAP